MCGSPSVRVGHIIEGTIRVVRLVNVGVLLCVAVVLKVGLDEAKDLTSLVKARAKDRERPAISYRAFGISPFLQPPDDLGKRRSELILKGVDLQFC